MGNELAQVGIDGIVGGFVVAVLCTVAFGILWQLLLFVQRVIRGLDAWAKNQKRALDTTPEAAFPVLLAEPEEREGVYRVSGVLRETEAEVDWTIEARSQANAIAKAELRGLVVTKVERMP